MVTWAPALPLVFATLALGGLPVAVAVPLAAAAAGSVALIGPGGRAAGQLVIPLAPSWIELAAAREISEQLLAATGANLTVVSEAHAQSGRPSLYVGRTRAGAKASAGRPALKPEGYAVFVTSGAGFLMGDDDCNVTWPRKITDNSECRRGSLFGAFALLRHLGFEWLWPGPGGQATPDLRSRGVGLGDSLELTDAPELAMRRYRPIYSNTAEVYGRYASKVPWLINHTLLESLARDESEWLLRAGMGSHDTPQWGQAFGSWWGEWGDNGTLGHHPEWFALLPPNTDVNPSPEPRRGPWMHDGHTETAGVKMCVSNPGLHSQVAKGYLPGTPGVSACEDDGDQGFCTCAKCRAWDAGPTQGPNSTCFNHTHQNWKHEPSACRGQYSDRYARFFDSVAAVLAKQFPEKPPTVTGYAYDNYRNPPLNYTIKGNVMIGLVVGVFGSNATVDEEEKAIWHGWHTKGAKRMFWRPNVGSVSGVGPSQRSVATVATLKWLGQHGLDATDIDSMENHWALSGFTYYVTARAQWHPTRYSHEAALTGFCTAGFGEKAGAIAAEYLRFWEVWSQNETLSAAGWTDTLLARAEATLTRLTAACGGYRGCAAKAAFWASGLQHARLTTTAALAHNKTGGCPTDRACAMGDGFLPAALALLRYRRQIAPSFAVNIFDQSMREVDDHDATGISAAAAVEPLLLPHSTPAVQMSVNDWAFAFDPRDVGLSSSPPWYSPAESTKHRGNGSRWQRVSVGLPWNHTLPGEQWAAAHGGGAYGGVGWYRTLFGTDLFTRNASKFVLVANVSGAATVWLNGLQLQQQPAAASQPPLPPPSSPAQKAVGGGLVAFDLTREIIWFGKNSLHQHLAIRVDGGGGDGESAVAAPGVVSQVFVLGCGALSTRSIS